MTSSPPRAFILIWNPLRWVWRGLEKDILAVASGRDASETAWSTGNTRSVKPGDRLFLLKLGQEPRGLMGAGYATSGVYESEHWDAAKRATGERTWRVNLHFDCLLHPDAVLPLESLRQGPLGEFYWTPAASGVSVPAHLVPHLEELWAAFNRRPSPNGFAEELPPEPRYLEGAARTVVVNRYERDPRAREACIQRHGTRCVVCDFSFGERYGAHGEGFIQVHHLTPLASLSASTAIDPVQDLRPVCANCHVMLHRGETLLTPEELKAILRA